MKHRQGKTYMSAERQRRLRTLVMELGELLGDAKAADAVLVRLIGSSREELQILQELTVLLQEYDPAQANQEGSDSLNVSSPGNGFLFRSAYSVESTEETSVAYL